VAYFLGHPVERHTEITNYSLFLALVGDNAWEIGDNSGNNVVFKRE